MTLFTCKVASVPGSTANSELTDALRTLRYHYLCKVYLPMYRALHSDQLAEEHRQPLAAVGSWPRVDNQRNPAGASTRNRPCSQLIERSTFHRELLLLRSRRSGHEKRCWSLEGGDAERWRQNRNKKNFSGAFSKSDRNLSTVAAAAAAGKRRPFGSANIYDQQQLQLSRSHSLALASFSASSTDSKTLNFCNTSSASCHRSVGRVDYNRNCDDQLDCSHDKETSDCDRDNFEARQMALQQEAQLALAMAQTMARMQLEVEKQMKKRKRASSPPSLDVTLEIIENRRNLGGSNQITNRLDRMNLAEVQLIANDLLSQIEELNEELMRLLLERDELHMEQDSVLVDIDDFTRRAQETTLTLKFHQTPQGGAAVSTAS